MQRVFKVGKLPIYGEIVFTRDYILKVSSFFKLRIDTGKFFKPVLLRSKLVSSDSSPSQSGAYPKAILAKASYFSFLKFLIAAGKVVNLLPERSRKVRAVNFSKLSGRSLNKLLSDYSFFSFPSLPKFSGNESN